jgi:hypothetical protein
LTFAVYRQFVEAPVERSKSRWLRALDLTFAVYWRRALKVKNPS